MARKPQPISEGPYRITNARTVIRHRKKPPGMATCAGIFAVSCALLSIWIEATYNKREIVSPQQLNSSH